jgi:Putative DNA-binding domain
VPVDPPELERLERWFSVSIAHPEGPRRGVESDLAAQLLPEAARDLETVVLPSKSLDAMDRLSIYANMYFDRFAEILAEEFPTVRHIVGPQPFSNLIRAYITRYPSRHYSLAQLGARFPRFLDEHADDALVPHRGFVVAVATVERTMEDVFDAEQAEALTTEQLQQMSPDRWGQLPFKTIPAFRLLTLAYPVNACITALRREKPFDIPAAGQTHVAIYRKNYKVWRVDLNAHQHALLGALHAGCTLEEAIIACAELPGIEADELAASVQEWFQNWTAEGLFRRL